jgi:hypothetical protein
LTDIRDEGRSPGEDVHNGADGTIHARVGLFTIEFKAEVVALVRQPGNSARAWPAISI